jgi:error-prone DNA polymerase
VKDIATGRTVRLAALVAAMRRVPTRQGVLQFLTLEDETGILEAALLPAVYRRLGNRVTTPGPFIVEGELRRQQGAPHLEVCRIAPFHERSRPYGRG